jgi:hypothetical protein
LSGYEKVPSIPATGTTVNSNTPVPINATCPGTKRVVGGGYLGAQNSGDNRSALVIISSGPNASNTGWQVLARRADNGSYTVTAYALCANVISQ